MIETDVLKELSHFENFFYRMGFKRIDGSVYGLLALSEKPLTSEEIESILNLSQSAVSLSLKSLTHFGAIETRDTRDLKDNSKAKVHSAKEDSLNIVASVFRKREEEYINDFKNMAQRVLDRSSGVENQARRKRMQSILTTCEIAGSVMNFVITIAQNKSREHYEMHSAQYDAIVKKLPKALDLLASTAGPLTDITLGLKDNFRETISENLKDKFKNNFKGLR